MLSMIAPRRSASGSWKAGRSFKDDRGGTDAVASPSSTDRLRRRAAVVQELSFYTTCNHIMISTPTCYVNEDPSASKKSNLALLICSEKFTHHGSDHD